MTTATDCRRAADTHCEINFGNAKKNPRAQTRDWAFAEGSFGNDPALNPSIEGRVRKLDCGQITDGAACVILASERFARAHSQDRGLQLADMPRIKGWGHRSAPILLETKLAASKGPRAGISACGAGAGRRESASGDDRHY
jgi:acetyl-CoA C-acetyltransferase